MARKEVYYHPLLPIGHPFRQEDGVCGDFVKAVGEGKVLATYNELRTHAISLFNVTQECLIFKDSYNNVKQHSINRNRQRPELGHFISFRRVTDRNEENLEIFGLENLISINLLEMGFDQSVVEEANNHSDSDFDAALAYCYSNQ